MDLSTLGSPIPSRSIFSAADIEYTNQKSENFSNFQDFDEFVTIEIIIDHIIDK